MQNISRLQTNSRSGNGCRLLKFALALAFVATCGQTSIGQHADSNSKELSAAEKSEHVQALCRLLTTNYVFPDIAEQIVLHLQMKDKAGGYSEVSDESAFAKSLTEDIRSINRDLHLSVRLTAPKSKTDETNLGTEFSRSVGKHSNYGFEEAKILPGNIGYIKMSSFSLDQLYDQAKGTATAAMSFISNTDAVIFDLRDNRGGSPRLSRYLSSYLFNSKPVHLNDFYFRTNDTTLEYWTLATVSGKRMPESKVFIMINGGTFSAAEGFAYNLKHLDRATIVGEASGGGAHGGSTHSLTERFQVYIPFSRSIHPVTKTDFEGVGVIPNVEVESRDALLTSHILAIESLIGSKLNEQNGTLYTETLETLKARKNPVLLDNSDLKKYVGTYVIAPEKSLVISMKEGKLFGQMTGDEQKVAVSPITKTRFRADGYKVEFTFELNSEGDAAGLTIHQGDGIKAKKSN